MKEVTYFIQEDRVGGLIKIGKSVDPRNRLKSLATGNSVRLVLLGCTSESEEALHLRFKQERVSGEWFYPSTEILSYACRQLREPEEVTETKVSEQDCKKIIAALKIKSPLSRSQITHGIFKRNRTAHVSAALNELQNEGLIRREMYRPKSCRPTEFFYLTPKETK